VSLDITQNNITNSKQGSGRGGVAALALHKFAGLGSISGVDDATLGFILLLVLSVAITAIN